MRRHYGTYGRRRVAQPVRGLQRPRTRRRPQQLVHADANAACRVRAR